MTAENHFAENRKQRLRRLDRIFVRTPIYFVTCIDKSWHVSLFTKLCGFC
jgi:hypothetical protein